MSKKIKVCFMNALPPRPIEVGASVLSFLGESKRVPNYCSICNNLVLWLKIGGNDCCCQNHHCPNKHC